MTHTDYQPALRNLLLSSLLRGAPKVCYKMLSATTNNCSRHKAAKGPPREPNTSHEVGTREGGHEMTHAGTHRAYSPSNWTSRRSPTANMASAGSVPSQQRELQCPHPPPRFSPGRKSDLFGRRQRGGNLIRLFARVSAVTFATPGK